jgi:integrase
MPRRPKNLNRSLRWGQGSVEVRGDRFIARWTEDGRKRSRTFPDLDSAEEYLRTRARRGGDVTVEVTVKDLIGDWLDRGQHTWAENTYATYKAWATNHVLPTLGDVPAKAITTARIQYLIDDLRGSLSPSSIEGCMSVLNGAFRAALRLGLVDSNPVTGVQKPAIRRKPMVTWSQEHVRKVIDALADDPMYQALYALALSTGMRPGELRALRWSDIQLSRNRLTVQRTMTRDKDGHGMVGNRTKSGETRVLSLSPRVGAFLRVWRGVQTVISIDGYVFTGLHGGPLPRNTWQKRHVRLIKEAGVPSIHLHGLRHTAASLMLEQNVHAKIVSDMLGHGKIQITLDTYSHPSDALLQATAETMGEWLFGESIASKI